MMAIFRVADVPSCVPAGLIGPFGSPFGILLGGFALGTIQPQCGSTPHQQYRQTINDIFGLDSDHIQIAEVILNDDSSEAVNLLSPAPLDMVDYLICP